jgi:hypothetical protein
MILYVLDNLSKCYSEVVTAMKLNGIAGKLINNLLRLAVRDMWERSDETKAKKSSEQRLHTMFKKKFTKKYKGICGYCGKQGHKIESCLKNK